MALSKNSNVIIIENFNSHPILSDKGSPSTMILLENFNSHPFFFHQRFTLYNDTVGDEVDCLLRHYQVHDVHVVNVNHVDDNDDVMSLPGA